MSRRSDRSTPQAGDTLKPTAILQRHYFWSNFEIADKEFAKDHIRSAQIPDLQAKHGYDLSSYKLPNKRQVLRNCVSPELGLYALRESQRTKLGGEK